MLSKSVDPITFEVIRSALDSMVDEMALTMMRTAHSAIVKDAMDYSTAFCNQRGEVLAQGLTIVMHLGAFPDAVAAVQANCGEPFEPGDLFILNDPYGSGGIHLPDIFVIKPVFLQGEHVGFSCVVAHHTDVGGIVPGSNSTDSTEIFQEGLRIPVLRLHRRGVPDQTLLALVERNVRVPDKVLGDLRAQVAAANIGERGYVDLCTRYGHNELFKYTDALLDYSEHMTRKELIAIPKGEYEFVDYIDADNIEGGPVTIHVTLSAEGEKIKVDFDGSSSQVKAGINSPFSYTKSATYGAIRLALDPAIPNNAGCYRAIEVKAPVGTVVNPREPAPCGARGITGFRIMDAVMGALATAIPDRVPADGEGGNTIISIGGYDNKNKPFTYVDLICGARGGTPWMDGPEGVPHPGANISNMPIEIAEAEFPVRIERYGLVEDSGGAGKYRGGLSQIREVRCLADDATLQFRSDKRKFPPYGLHDGKPGSASQNILFDGNKERPLPTMGTATIHRDDLFRHLTAGGGGWGNPFDRNPEQVRQDVVNEKLSLAAAKRDYGVVINPKTLQVDFGATEDLRQAMRRHLLPDQPHPRFDPEPQ